MRIDSPDTPRFSKQGKAVHGRGPCLATTGTESSQKVMIASASSVSGSFPGLDDFCRGNKTSLTMTWSQEATLSAVVMKLRIVVVVVIAVMVGLVVCQSPWFYVLKPIVYNV